MAASSKLKKTWAKYAQKRRRQVALFKSTKRRGHARKAARYGRIMARLRKEIEHVEITGRPKWKMAWVARFVARWEGLLFTAYQDSGGVWTVGYGHTGSDVGPGTTLTKAKALALLASDLRAAARAVARNIHVPLTRRQRIAAISFAFNVGEGGLRESTFLRELNNGSTRDAANALLLWVKDADGSVLLGLQRRRRAERWLFLHPTR